MARRPRLFLPDIPFHVIQRGNNRSRCFLREADYRAYRQWLADYAAHFRCAIHAYVLMPNHVHLLITPGDAQGPSRFMQSLGRRYVAYVNRVHQRTGTLWEARFRASPVETEAYLFRLYRYIELNPVRAGIVAHPSQYPWSSHSHNGAGRHDPVVKAHPLYLELARDEGDRLAAYRGLFGEPLGEDCLALIRAAAVAGLPVGSAGFHRQIEKTFGIRLAAPPGRQRPSSPATTEAQVLLADNYDSDPKLRL
jgi:putative transposase